MTAGNDTNNNGEPSNNNNNNGDSSNQNNYYMSWNIDAKATTNYITHYLVKIVK